MQVIRMTRENEDFYRWMGPVFGSRLIEQETHDRFYDDPGKLWHLIKGLGTASVRDSVIRNFWAGSAEAAEALVADMLLCWPDLSGIVPRSYESTFRAMGFKTFPHRKNFIEVRRAVERPADCPPLKSTL